MTHHGPLSPRVQMLLTANALENMADRFYYNTFLSHTTTLRSHVTDLRSSAALPTISERLAAARVDALVDALTPYQAGEPIKFSLVLEGERLNVEMDVTVEDLLEVERILGERRHDQVMERMIQHYGDKAWKRDMDGVKLRLEQTADDGEEL